MKVIGYQSKEFKFDDGKVVDGINLYLTDQRSGVTGVACERVSCSKQRLGGYEPKLGDEIKILYNRFGKVESVECVATFK